MNAPWPFTSWMEVALTGACVLAIIVVTGVFLVRFPGPYQASSNFGLGPGWTCSYPGRGEPVCTKD